MAVQEQTPYIEYTANGATTSFALGFDCESKDHLIVLIDDIEPPIATWSLTGGNVVFTTAPAAGKKITIQRNTPYSRTTDYQSYNNSFRPPSVNKDFDWIWWKLQELGVADWILSNRIDALKNYVDDRDDELRAYLMEEIRKQGVALDQLEDYYNYLMQRLAQIAVDKGWDASFVVDGNETQHEINNKTIRTVETVADLQNLEVWPGRTVFIKTRNGEENSLFAGTFVYSQNSTEDVDNGIVLNAEGGRWIRKIENNVIKAQWFGTPNLIDDQKILNPAFNASRKYKLFVDITGNEWGINGVVSALDRVSLISNFDSVILVDPSGDYPRKFAIEFGLPGSVWYQNGCVLTNTGFLRVECKNRDTRLHGVFIKGPLSNVDIIRTSNFNGTGIKLESVHDTPLNRLSIEFCGNEEDYAFVCGSADDTTNCININALQVEQSYQRGIYITNTIRSVINNIHSERLFRTNQAPVDNLIGNDLNHVIQMSNSVINQAIIHSNNGDIYVRLDGAVNNYNNFLVPDGYVYGEYGDQVIYSCLNTKVFKQLSILKDITLDQPSIPVVHVTIGTKINNPKIDELVFEYAAKSITATGGSIGKVGVRSSEAINGDIVFNNVAIKEVRETGSNSILAMAFNNCNIDLLEGMQSRTCKFRDSYIYRANLASGLQAYFDNVKFDSFTATGDIKYLTRNCQSVNNPTWSLPTVPMNKGLITERIGYDAAGKIYQNTIDGVNWQKLI